MAAFGEKGEWKGDTGTEQTLVSFDVKYKSILLGLRESAFSNTCCKLFIFIPNRLLNDISPVASLTSVRQI